ncbi:hypothetical protein MalM25_22250 [Planctomycetes bacterium MalM25]|nr:hypothetical protein MalM25_22250 [Planctomycetes bacterium MalM25]
MRFYRATLSLAVLSALLPYGAASSAQSTVFSTDFTSASYVNGPLGGQSGWAASGGTTITSGVGASIDGFEDIVNSAWSPASKVAEGETYTSTVTFSYDDNSLGTGSGPHLGASLYSGTAIDSGQLNMLIRRTADAYRLTLADNWGSAYGAFGFNQSPTFTPESIGIAHGSDSTSDTLSLSLALTAGADVNSWTALGTLYNETTATEVATWDVGGAAIDFAAPIGSSIYGGWAGGQSDGNQTIANRTATSFEFGSSVNAPITNVYQADFSDASRFPGGGEDPFVELRRDGFVSDKVSVTNNGTATDASWWDDNPDTGFATTINRKAAAYVSDAAVYTSSIDFSFEVDPETAGAGPLIQTGLFNGQDPFEAERLAIYLNRDGSGVDYRLRPTTNWGNAYPDPQGFQQSGAFDEAALGLDSDGAEPDVTSDQIRLTTTLIQGVDETGAWVVKGELTNLDVDPTTPFFSYTVPVNSDFDAPLDSVLYAGFGTGQGGATSQSFNREVSAFNFDVQGAIALESPEGDFNDDGVVDAADYSVWRDNQNGSEGLPNDGGLGTPIAQAHYDLWSDNYGAIIGVDVMAAATQVPEPGTWVLTACLSLLSLIPRSPRKA